jgi:hypothetical protein
MFSKTDSINLWIIFFFTMLGFLVLLTHIVMIKRKARMDKMKGARISKEIIEYFRKTGVNVSAVSTNLRGDNHFTAFDEAFSLVPYY